MTNTFTWNPDEGAKGSHESTRRIVKFGDGYEQRTDVNLNADLPKWELSFSARSLAESASISAFLGAQGCASFYWTPPGGSQGLYVCDSWNETHKSNGTEVTATFRRVSL